MNKHRLKCVSRLSANQPVSAHKQLVCRERGKPKITHTYSTHTSVVLLYKTQTAKMYKVVCMVVGFEHWKEVNVFRWTLYICCEEKVCFQYGFTHSQSSTINRRKRRAVTKNVIARRFSNNFSWFEVVEVWWATIYFNTRVEFQAIFFNFKFARV